MLLTKDPVLVPSVVWFPKIVGLGEVPQQTPLAVTALPPSEVIVPPQVAEVSVILETAAVVTVGAESNLRQRKEDAIALLELPIPQYPLRKSSLQPMVVLPCKLLQ